MEFGRAWHCLFVGENKTGEGELSRRGWRWRLKREVEVKKGRENCQEEQGKLRGEETGGKAESVWGKRGRSEQEARAILSSGGILLQEKLGNSSCWALRGESPAREQTKSCQGCLGATTNCFCCSGGSFAFLSYAYF